jgi:hypothetical protein
MSLNLFLNSIPNIKTSGFEELVRLSLFLMESVIEVQCVLLHL